MTIHIPSRLASWVLWRNRYTEPDMPAFNMLTAMTETEGLTRSDWREAYPICPFCDGDASVKHEGNEYFCLCYILEWIGEKETRYGTQDNRFDGHIRSNCLSATWDDITYPEKWTADQKKSFALAEDAVKKFINNPNHWLLLGGTYGSGKTLLLRIIATAMSPIAVYITAGDLEDMVHEHRQSDTLQYLNESLVLAPILILDDIGMEYGGKLVQTVITKIINARYERYPDFPIVAATNMKWDELGRYIPRASDRMMDYGKVKRVGLQTPSYRALPTWNR